ncbi:MAG TPA: signal peptidase II [Fibrobacteria bacterium]|nr:signal peptidase II [Fibrobacteria bacterium]
MTRRKINLLARPSVSVGILLAVVALDQVSKALALSVLGDSVFGGAVRSDHARRLVGDFLWLFVAYNPGAVFSFAPQKLVPFLHPTLFYGVLVGVVGYFLGRLWIDRKNPLVRTAVALVLGGGVGNFIDRVRIDHVVDFISMGVPGITWRWPTFNLADAAICIGAVLLVVGERQVVLQRDHRDARRVPVPKSDEQGPDSVPSAGGNA